jgi:transposase
MSKKHSVYSNCNPHLSRLFEQVAPGKLLCVPMDYAKSSHTVLICNGRGDLLKPSFVIPNTAEGAEKLLGEVQRCARQERIALEHVFFAGEDDPSFAENFVRALRQRKFLVVRVNAWEARQQRSNFQASSDRLDLLGIARCCLNRRGETVRERAPAYANLRTAMRQRAELVRARTAASNRLHPYVDRLFPGFLDGAQSGIVPFSRASLDLMEENFSPAQLARRQLSALAQWLEDRGVEQAHEKAAQLKDLARKALPPERSAVPILQSIVSKLVSLYRGLDGSISALDREAAYWLAQTPGALLTSINGIGVTLAAGWIAELGAPQEWRAVRRTCSYAGVVSRTKQTGGPERGALVGHAQHRCNKRLKNAVLQTVEKVRQYGSPELLEQFMQLDERGAHTERLMAKRLIRICKCVVLSENIYRPKALLAETTEKQVLADYMAAAWEKILPKWKAVSDLNRVFAPENPLGKWRAMARELYGLELRLPRQRGADKPAPKTP